MTKKKSKKKGKQKDRDILGFIGSGIIGGISGVILGHGLGTAGDKIYILIGVNFLLLIGYLMYADYRTLNRAYDSDLASFKHMLDYMYKCVRQLVREDND